MELLTRLEDIQTQLDESWPKTLEKTLQEFDHGNEDFYIYTFTKWDYHQNPPRFDINHCPIKFLPQSWFLPGSTMRKVSPKGGWVKIIWTLPEEHSFDLYTHGKIFAEPIVCESIRKYMLKEPIVDEDDTYKKI